MATTTDLEVLASSDWLAHRYDEAQDLFHFCHIPWADRAPIPFLSDDALHSYQERHHIAAQQIDPKSSGTPLHFIFHSAFCASTLLAKALAAGPVSSLSEPQLLNDMIGALRRGMPPTEVARALDQALALLARPGADTAMVVIKPSNLVNHLAQAMLMLRPESRAVFLFAPLDVFLGSVARKGLWCRLWVRELLEGFLTDQAVDLGMAPGDYFRQSDLQVAATGWLAQHALFHKLAAKLGPGRIATLDSETLTARPADVLAAAAAHYGLAASADDVAAMAASPAFTRHSKSGAAFDAATREAEYAAARAAHDDEIGKVATWVRAVAEANGIAETLPLPLLG